MILIYGSEEHFISKYIKELKEKYKDSNIFIFENDFNIYEFIEFIETKNLFNSKKLIFVKDIAFLKKNKLDKNDEKLVNVLCEKLSSSNDEIVFILYNEKLPNNKFCEFIKDNSKIYECNKIHKNDLVNQVFSLFTENQVKITYSDVLFLLEKLPNNLDVVMNEINKLILNYKEITRKIIDIETDQYLLNNEFAFINSIETLNLNSIYSKYKERINEGDDVNKLISYMNTILGDTLVFYNYQKLNYSLNEISKILKQPEWKLKKINNTLTILGIRKISKMIEELSEIDLAIKTTGAETNEIFETFLIKNF
ncbi:DNA polymerase III subunit delta [Mycoplasma leonicaptivi]|uniref:DNA polymerase III subunit delta n=1 Tax=Mycoplasma leonicaptivi TaxID=36742 RepID=UPI000489B8D3|nr:hypothetical protein [Mycoplasma leonicaptivi]